MKQLCRVLFFLVLSIVLWSSSGRFAEVNAGVNPQGATDTTAQTTPVIIQRHPDGQLWEQPGRAPSTAFHTFLRQQTNGDVLATMHSTEQTVQSTARSGATDDACTPNSVVGLPTLLGPADSAATASLIPEFSWQHDVNDARVTDYRWQLATTGDFSTITESVRIPTSYYTPNAVLTRTPLDNLAPNTIYYWRVVNLCDISGIEVVGGTSAVRSFQTGSNGTILPAPTQTAPADGATANSTSVAVEYSTVAAATGYQVRFYRTPEAWDGSWFRAYSGLTGTLVTASGFTPGETLYWRVAARNGYAWGTPSAIRSFTIAGTNQDVCSSNTVIGLPTLVDPADGAATASLIPEFQWQHDVNDAQVTDYRWQLTTTPDFSTIIDSVWIPTNFYPPNSVVSYSPLDNLAPNTIYYWRIVNMCDANGFTVAGGTSEVRSFQTGSNGTILPAPTQTAPADGAAVGTSEVTVEYSAVTGATSYQIRFYHTPEAWDGSWFRASSTSGTSLTRTGFTVGETVYWRVAARNGYAWGTPSAVRSFIMSDPDAVIVTLPNDASGAPHSRVTIPVQVPNAVDGFGIIAYSFQLTFDPTVLSLPANASEAFNTAGTMSAGWSLTPNTGTPGELRIAGFSATPLTGSGTLLNLIFDVVGPANSSTALTWSDFLFNEGIPGVQTTDGFFTVLSYTLGGQVFYQDRANRAMSGVTIDLSGDTTDQAITDGAGYSFTTTTTGAHTLTPSYNGPVNGISAFDAAYIAQCVAGLRDSADCPLLAADTSGNSSLSAFDAALIAQYAAGLAGPTSRVGTWIFAPVARSYPAIEGDLLAEDFGAYLVGEVTGNWSAPATAAGTGRTERAPEAAPAYKEFLPLIQN